jgi:hypothetical protein
MVEGELTIGDLHLRLPGRGPEEARRLGAAVARHLADPGISPRVSRKIGTMNLRVEAGAGVSTEALAAQIALAIRRQVT